MSASIHPRSTLIKVAVSTHVYGICIDICIGKGMGICIGIGIGKGIGCMNV